MKCPEVGLSTDWKIVTWW